VSRQKVFVLTAREVKQLARIMRKLSQSTARLQLKPELRGHIHDWALKFESKYNLVSVKVED
jgi:hypothetical protein